MNKKNLALVMFLLIAMLALSAFRWAPNHLATATYHQSERADYSAFYVSRQNLQQSLDADAARYTAMAEFYNADAISIQSGLDADAARYTGMAKYYMSERNSTAMSFHYTSPGR